MLFINFHYIPELKTKLSLFKQAQKPFFNLQNQINMCEDLKKITLNTKVFICLSKREKQQRFHENKINLLDPVKSTLKR